MDDVLQVILLLVLCATYGMLIWAGTLGNR
jgi:hypothetical protein